MADQLKAKDREVRAAYDAVAAEYAACFATGEILDAELPYVSTLRDIGGDGAARLLDLGCGPAVYLPIAQQLGLRYVGTDFSPGMLRVARRTHPVANLLLADSRYLPIAPDSFDLTVAMGSLSHMDSDEFATAVRGIARVLRPGGALLLGDQLGRGSFKAPYPLIGSGSIWVFLRSWDRYLNEISRAGFSIVRVDSRPPMDGEYQTEKIILWAKLEAH